MSVFSEAAKRAADEIKKRTTEAARQVAPAAQVGGSWQQQLSPYVRPEQPVQQSQQSQQDKGYFETANEMYGNAVANAANAVKQSVAYDNDYTPPDQTDFDVEQAKANLVENEEKGKETAKDSAYQNFALSTGAGYGGALTPERMNILGMGDKEEWLDENPDIVNDYQRKADELERRKAQNNWFGLTSQDFTNGDALGIYNHYFTEEDADTRSDYEKFEDGDLPYWRLSADNDLVDDGYSASTREALFMTGEQYIKYRTEFGIPGRPVEEIDPSAIYSKQDEQDEYGFIPYLVSEEGMAAFHDNSVPHEVANIFGEVSNARNATTDYDVIIDGKRYSNKELQAAMRRWEIDDSNHGAYPQFNYDSGTYVFMMPDADGNLAAVSDWGSDPKTGKSYVTFFDSDKPLTFNSEDERRAAMDPSFNDLSKWREAKPEEYGYADIIPSTPYVLDDGTEIPWESVQAITDPETNKIKDEFKDYGMFNINKDVPTSPFSGLFDEDPKTGVDFSDVVPWLMDAALSSAPYFAPMPVSMVKAAGDVFSYGQGMRPGAQNSRGEYNLFSFNGQNMPTSEQKRDSMIGAALTPFMERLWGPLGGRITKGGVPFFTKIGTKLGFNPASPGFKVLEGAFGEGLEEIPGNITEEITNNGFRDFYANPLYIEGYEKDENGNDDPYKPIYTKEAFDEEGNQRQVARDYEGREIRDSDTGLFDRGGNYLADVPDSVFAGFALGGLAPQSFGAIPGYYSEYNSPSRLFENDKGDIQMGSFSEMSPKQTYEQLYGDEKKPIREKLNDWLFPSRENDLLNTRTTEGFVVDSPLQRFAFGEEPYFDGGAWETIPGWQLYDPSPKDLEFFRQYDQGANNVFSPELATELTEEEKAAYDNAVSNREAAESWPKAPRVVPPGWTETSFDSNIFESGAEGEYSKEQLLNDFMAVHQGQTLSPYEKNMIKDALASGDARNLKKLLDRLDQKYPRTYNERTSKQAPQSNVVSPQNAPTGTMSEEQLEELSEEELAEVSALSYRMDIVANFFRLYDERDIPEETLIKIHQLEENGPTEELQSYLAALDNQLKHSY